MGKTYNNLTIKTRASFFLLLIILRPLPNVFADTRFFHHRIADPRSQNSGKVSRTSFFRDTLSGMFSSPINATSIESATNSVIQGIIIGIVTDYALNWLKGTSKDKKKKDDKAKKAAEGYSMVNDCFNRCKDVHVIANEVGVSDFIRTYCTACEIFVARYFATAHQKFYPNRFKAGWLDLDVM